MIKPRFVKISENVPENKHSNIHKKTECRSHTSQNIRIVFSEIFCNIGFRNFLGFKITQPFK